MKKKIKKKVACVDGVTGQTASWLVELLLKKNYKVYGLLRRASNFNTQRIDHLFDNPNLKLVYGDVTDFSSIVNFITNANPELYFHLAAQSHVRVSFDLPEYTMDVVGTGTLRCLEAIKRYSPQTRFLNASTSELFGTEPSPQNEDTKISHPRSPYGVAKLAAHAATVNYREMGLFAVNSISFNHGGMRRGKTFITRKLTTAATRIKLGLQDKVRLGNLSSKRDITDARDVVRAMYLIITAPEPKDYVIASEETRSIEEIVDIVFSKLGLNWKEYVEFDPEYLRPTEVPELCGDASKIRRELGWAPEYSFDEMIQSMIDYDMELALREKALTFDMRD